MVDQQPHVSVEQGDGLVARFGDCVVLVAQTDAAEAAVEEVLEAVEAAAADSGAPGATVATRLAAIVAARAGGAVPPFGVVAPLEDTMVVFLHGHVWADITGAEGSEWISGQQAVTWVDHIARAPVRLLSVGSGESPVKADPRSDLRAGRVPGSGFVLTPAGSKSEPPAESDGGPPTMSSPEARPTEAPAVVPEEVAAETSAPRPEPTPPPEPTAVPEPPPCPGAGGGGHRAAGRDRCPRHHRPGGRHGAAEPEREPEPERKPEPEPKPEAEPQPAADDRHRHRVQCRPTPRCS